MKKVNLIYYNNGVGLTKDVKILQSALSGMFDFIEYDAFGIDCPSADINIFLQNVDQHTVKFVDKAKTNILIPNLEWMSQFSLDNIHKF